MAQIHDIDGITVNFISQAPWSQDTNSQSLDLITVHEKWRNHTWLSNVMTAAEWSTFIGKRGSIVSITTTDPNDLNGDYITFYNAIIGNITFNSHESLNFRGVRVEFLVKV